MGFTFSLLQNDYTVCPPGWGMTDECAVFHRIYYVCGGEAYEHRKGKDIRLEKGYLYVFPVMEPYTLWHNPADPLEVLWFHVECSPGLGRGLEKLWIEEGAELDALLQCIRVLQRRPENFEDVLQIFPVFLHQLSQRLHAPQMVGSRMKRVLDYLEESLEQGVFLTVEDLAAYAGVERAYFSRIFCKEFQMPPSRYLLAKRMNRASHALMEGKSIWEAAQAAGYQDEKSFSRAFRTYMEISPAGYRKKHMERL